MIVCNDIIMVKSLYHLKEYQLLLLLTFLSYYQLQITVFFIHFHLTLPHYWAILQINYLNKVTDLKKIEDDWTRRRIFYTITCKLRNGNITLDDWHLLFVSLLKNIGVKIIKLNFKNKAVANYIFNKLE